MTEEGFALNKTFVHLGLGPIAVALPNFSWDQECLQDYSRRFAADGAEGRLVCITPQAETWSSWERHPAGDELVVLLSGQVDVIQELPDGHLVVELLRARPSSIPGTCGTRATFTSRATRCSSPRAQEPSTRTADQSERPEPSRTLWA